MGDTFLESQKFSIRTPRGEPDIRVVQPPRAATTTQPPRPGEPTWPIKNWSKFKAALIAGAQEYLDKRKDPKKSGKYKCGVFFREHIAGLYHGKAGIDRAQNFLDLVQKNGCKTDDDKRDLLALVAALFKSSSSGLTQFVADVIIKGSVTLFSHSASEDRDTLTSDSLTDSVLKSIKDDPNLKECYGTEANVMLVLNKVWAMSAVFSNFSKTLAPEKQRSFNESIKVQSVTLATARDAIPTTGGPSPHA